MQKKIILFSIIWSFVGIVISVLINMFLTPYVTEVMGIEAFGYISLANNLIGYIDLIMSTINVYALRFMAIEYHNGNMEKANKYFNSILFANIIFGVVLLVPGTAAICYMDSFLNIPKGLTSDVKYLFLLVLANYLLSLIGTAFNAATFIMNVIYKTSRSKAISNLIKALAMLALFVCFQTHVWYVALAGIFATMYVLFTNMRYTRSLTPEFKISKKHASWKDVKELMSTGMWNTLASFGTILNSGLDLLVTNIYLGATKMGQLSIAKTLSAMITLMLTAVSDSFRPHILQSYAQNKTRQMIDEFKVAMKCCGLVSCTIISVFIGYGLNFMNLWVPSQDTELIYHLTILTIIAETFVGITKPLHYVCVLTKKVKVPCIANLLVGVFNVVSMIMLLNFTKFGIYAVVWTTVVGNIGYNFVIMPWYVTKILPYARTDFYSVIFRYIFTSVLTVAIVKLFSKVINPKGWLELFICLFISAILASAIYFICMFSKEEKKRVVGVVKKKLFRKKD